MQRDHAWPASSRIIHVVGRVTDEVASFLGPATKALAVSGFEQAVVMIDEPRYRRPAATLHEATELLLAPSVGNPVKQWFAVFDACRRALDDGAPHLVHLHGLVPCLIGVWAVRAAGVRAPIFYSPHGSRSLGTSRVLGTAAMLLVRPLMRLSRNAAIVNVPTEARAFERWEASELVESPVADVFFRTPRREAQDPLIVTGGRRDGARDVVPFAQLAVLLSGEDLRASFEWIGAVDQASGARLHAAGVQVLDPANQFERAARLAAGWIYIAPGIGRGFPVFLVEAMSAGLACVVLDCEQHREVIRDGETGYLCKTGREMIERIGMLIDGPALRERLGRAAREDASRRFAEGKFVDRLLQAYASVGSTAPEPSNRTAP